MIESPRHVLDHDIDRVAAKMVAVADDAGALQAVVSQLPQRESTPWFMRMPVQATAAAALVLVAFAWARPIDRQVIPAAVLPIAATAPPLVAARVAVPIAEGPEVRVPARVSPIPDPRSPIPEDHERSLPPVDAVEAIELVGIATPSIDVESALAIEPIVLTELALDTEGEE